MARLRALHTNAMETAKDSLAETILNQLRPVPMERLKGYVYVMFVSLLRTGFVGLVSL